MITLGFRTLPTVRQRKFGNLARTLPLPRQLHQNSMAVNVSAALAILASRRKATRPRPQQQSTLICPSVTTMGARNQPIILLMLPAYQLSATLTTQPNPTYLPAYV